MKNIRPVMFFLILAVVMMGLLPGKTTQAATDNFVKKFNPIKQRLSKRQVYFRVYSNQQSECFEVMHALKLDPVFDEFENIISSMGLSNIPAFIKQTYVLVKFYDFDPRQIIKLAKEKIVYLYVSDETTNLHDYIKKLDDIVENFENGKAKESEWPPFPIPNEHKQAAQAYFAYNYEVSALIWPSAVEAVKNTPIPDVNTEDPYYPDYVEQFELDRKYLLAMEYQMGAECHEYTFQWLNAYDWKNLQLALLASFYGSDNEPYKPFNVLDCGFQIVKGRICLYHLDREAEAFEIRDKLKVNIIDHDWGDGANSSYVLSAKITVYRYMGECLLYKKKFQDAQNAFILAEKVLIDYVNNEFPDNPNVGFEYLRINRGEIVFFQGLATECLMNFVDARVKYSEAKNYLIETIDPNSLFAWPSYYEMNKKYRFLISQRLIVTIDKNESSQFIYPGQVPLRIVFLYNVPSKRNSVIELKVYSKGKENLIFSKELAVNSSPDEQHFEWDGYIGNDELLSFGEFFITLEYSVIESKGKILKSIDGYTFQSIEKRVLDIIVDSNNDGALDETDELCEDSKDKFGFILNFNDDDDNSNFTPDYLESGSSDEDDLKPLKIVIDSSIIVPYGKLVLSCNQDPENRNIKIWKDQYKFDEEVLLPFIIQTPGTEPLEFYIEGVGWGDSRLTLEYQIENGLTYSDVAKVHSTGIFASLPAEIQAGEKPYYGLTGIPKNFNIKIETYINNFLYNSISKVSDEDGVFLEVGSDWPAFTNAGDIIQIKAICDQNSLEIWSNKCKIIPAISDHVTVKWIADNIFTEPHILGDGNDYIDMEISIFDKFNNPVIDLTEITLILLNSAGSKNDPFTLKTIGGKVEYRLFSPYLLQSGTTPKIIEIVSDNKHFTETYYVDPTQLVLDSNGVNIDPNVDIDAVVDKGKRETIKFWLRKALTGGLVIAQK